MGILMSSPWAASLCCCCSSLLHGIRGEPCRGRARQPTSLRYPTPVNKLAQRALLRCAMRLTEDKNLNIARVRAYAAAPAHTPPLRFSGPRRSRAHEH